MQPVVVAELEGWLGGDALATPESTCEELCQVYADLQGKWPSTDGACAVTARAEDGAPTTLECPVIPVCMGGRRPPALVPPESTRMERALGPVLARMAWLEAASVPAFEQLAADLERLGAPGELVRAARRAADEERSHALSVGALARREGSEPPPVVLGRTAARTLEEVAVENAVEGCVLETYAALVAAERATRSTDAQVREVFAVIAPEEVGHAELSWNIHAWAQEHLDVAGRARLQAAQRSALASLREELQRAPEQSDFAALWMPGRDEGLALAAHLEAAIEGTPLARA